jgi:hypothetical protein
MRDEIARNAPARRSNVVSQLFDVDGMTSGRQLALSLVSRTRRGTQ